MEIFELRSTKLENELIALQLVQETDFDKLFEVAADPLIWELHPAKDRYKKEVFQLYFNDALASESSFLVIDKATGDIIGCTRLYDIRPAQSSVAIGYTFLARKYWGGVYNSAMKGLLMEHVFKVVNNVMFHIAATNIRSQKAIGKLGATKVSEVDFDHYGTKLLHYEYRITKYDYYK
ncbi:GNAT family N-acetyltransferase [Mucilaginibacter sp. ZT4R22]|uniref:GNAT family N-acetyltransferase n=1 Tax=Mucilaginibacter pankratovii TaxID=2772110 RepID=A0ABR7WP19_9SPHI|nr:GNAT family N-acetyltransferase [Mucilaginibacter pankratovii]MBD1364032.1 GNAT family N-acetyltransferase [Mucilaginibacter pankratovii]